MGWQELWQDPEVAKRWKEWPPSPGVVAMADLLEAEGGRRVLDIGCGVGRHTIYLAARGFEVSATDNAPAAISACKNSLQDAGLVASVVEADMTDFAFPDSYFHGVVASHVIHHTDRATLKRVIDLISDKLAPGGVLAWATPTTRHCGCGRGREVEPGTWVNEEHPEGPIPHHYCSEQEVRELLSTYEILSMDEEESGQPGNRRYHWRIVARKRAEP